MGSVVRLHKFRVFTSLGVVLLLGGCTVLESATVDIEARQGCVSTLGSYFLPRAFIKVSITRTNGTAPNVLETIATVRRVDNHQLFCLDHASSVFADDEIVVKKDRDQDENNKTLTTRNQFLGLVTSKAVDQSSIIFRKIIRTIFVGIAQGGAILRSGARTSAGFAGGDSLKVEFDPLDQASLARANDAMRRFGFCMILEDFTYNPRHAEAEGYCNAPSVVAREPTVFHTVYAREVLAAPPIVSPGIYYRPRAPYRLAVYTSDDPERSRKWNLSKTEIVHLENVSPLLRLRIDRSAFAARRLALVFEDGTLVGSCLFKGSEVLGAIDIPLEIVRSIVKLPTAMFQVKIDEFTRSKQLIEAEQQLVLTQKAYIDFLNRKEGASAPTGGSSTATNTVAGTLNPVPVPGGTGQTGERLADPPAFTEWGSDIGALCTRTAP